MDNYLTNPNPDKAGAPKAHQLFRQKVKRSFIALIQECARVFNQSYQEQINHLNNLVVEQKFSFRIYYNYYSLLAYMAQNDKDSCQKICDNLVKILANETLYASELEVIGFQDREWEHLFLNDILNKGNKGDYEYINEEDFKLNKSNLSKALQNIKLSSADMYYEIMDHLSLIEIVKGNFYIYSASSVKYLGALPIAIPPKNVNPVYYYFDVIIHEESHQHLNILMGLDPLVVNKADELFHSPARKVPRPMKGIFHAHFVFYRLILMYKLAYKHFNLMDTKPVHQADLVSDKGIKDLPWDFNLRLSAYERKFQEGEDIIKNNAALTKAGWELFTNMSDNFASQLKGL